MSKARRPREIPKLDSIRLLELAGALQTIQDAVAAITHGRYYHLVTLAGQLRALLTERSGRADPLLLKIAHSFGRTLPIYYMPSADLGHLLPEESLLHVAGFPITLHRQFAGQQQIELSELLDKRIIAFKGIRYSARDVIEWYANKAGGAHYSRSLPEDFADLLSLDIAGVCPPTQVMVQIGKATLLIGLQFLKSISEFEMHAIIAIRAQPVNPTSFLFDMRDRNTPMQVKVELNERLIPRLRVTGLQNIGAVVEADRLIDWSNPRHLQFNFFIDDDMTSILEIMVDGERVGRERCPIPLLISSDLINYDFYHNNAADGEPQDFSFFLGEFLMLNKGIAGIERANLQLYFHSKISNPSLSLLHYKTRAYGYAASGTNDLTVTGEVERLTAEGLCSVMENTSKA